MKCQNVDTITPNQYIFGYGSLISENSRKRTVNSDKAIPVLVSGYTRSWSYKCPRREYTAVSVQHSKNKSDTINGVLIKLVDPQNDLLKLDLREKNYARGIIPIENIQFLQSHLYPIEKNAIIWVYENHTQEKINFSSTSQMHIQQEHSPSFDCPIPASYIDCILKGCLKYSYEFALLFLCSTKGFSYDHYLNDRDHELLNRKYCGEDSEGHEVVDMVLRDSADLGWTLNEILDRLLKNSITRSISARSFSTSSLNF